MLRKTAMIFGAVMLLIGILGFIPGITTDDDMLLGIFHVDGVHNVIHILTGLAALAMSGTAAAARTFFQAFGVVYGLVALAGLIPAFVNDQGELFGLFHVNGADNVLHIAIALFALYMGFVYRDREVAAPRDA